MTTEQIALTAACLILGGVSAHAAAQPKDAEIVAAILIAEAGGEIKCGMAAIREVIDTRARAHRRKLVDTHRAKSFYQSDVPLMEECASVCLQRGQFSCLNGITPAKLVRRARKHPRWREAYALAVNGTTTNLTRGANHYHEASIKPAWSNGLPFIRIGRHLFYIL